jgi:peptidoglycan/LPS O-acetylase OafA/YrhL
MGEPPPPTERLHSLEALRGLAALAVALFHLAQMAPVPAQRVAPAAFELLRGYGLYGVEVFFVVSGFVIAHTTLRDPATPGALGRFLLRRLVRLGPPYWVSVLLAVALTLAATRLLGANPEGNYAVPSAARVASHFLYLQNLLGLGDIEFIYWTLCVEVQFYAVFALLLYAAGRLAGLRGDRAKPLAVLLVLTGAGSVALAAAEGYSIRWFGPWWYLYALGALLAVGADRGRFRPLAGVLVVTSAAAVGLRLGPEAAVGLGTAWLIFGTAATGQLATAGNWRPLQYLGRVSYSLYLIHPLVYDPYFTAAGRLNLSSPGASLAVTLGGLAAALVAAHVFYLLVERPSVNLSRRIRKAGMTNDPPMTHQ